MLNTGGGQAMGEELIHTCTDGQVKQAHRWRKRAAIMGYEAESNAFYHISLRKQVAKAENKVYTYKSW